MISCHNEDKNLKCQYRPSVYLTAPSMFVSYGASTSISGGIAGIFIYRDIQGNLYAYDRQTPDKCPGTMNSILYSSTGPIVETKDKKTVYSLSSGMPIVGGIRPLIRYLIYEQNGVIYIENQT